MTTSPTTPAQAPGPISIINGIRIQAPAPVPTTKCKRCNDVIDAKRIRFTQKVYKKDPVLCGSCSFDVYRLGK